MTTITKRLIIEATKTRLFSKENNVFSLRTIMRRLVNHRRNRKTIQIAAGFIIRFLLMHNQYFPDLYQHFADFLILIVIGTLIVIESAYESVYECVHEYDFSLTFTRTRTPESPACRFFLGF